MMKDESTKKLIFYFLGAGAFISLFVVYSDFKHESAHLDSLMKLQDVSYARQRILPKTIGKDKEMPEPELERSLSSSKSEAIAEGPVKEEVKTKQLDYAELRDMQQKILKELYPDVLIELADNRCPKNWRFLAVRDTEGAIDSECEREFKVKGIKEASFQIRTSASYDGQKLQGYIERLDAGFTGSKMFAITLDSGQALASFEVGLNGRLIIALLFEDGKLVGVDNCSLDEICMDFLEELESAVQGGGEGAKQLKVIISNFMVKFEQALKILNTLCLDADQELACLEYIKAKKVYDLGVKVYKYVGADAQKRPIFKGKKLEEFL